MNNLVDGQHRMKRIASVKQIMSPDKHIATHETGPYRIVLRQKAHKLPQKEDATYELAVWNGWVLCDKTDWSNRYFANRAYEKAKKRVAVELAKRVLFNQAEQPEDQ